MPDIEKNTPENEEEILENTDDVKAEDTEELLEEEFIGIQKQMKK